MTLQVCFLPETQDAGPPISTLVVAWPGVRVEKKEMFQGLSLKPRLMFQILHTLVNMEVGHIHTRETPYSTAVLRTNMTHRNQGVRMP